VDQDHPVGGDELVVGLITRILDPLGEVGEIEVAECPGAEGCGLARVQL
jgi:hypothetical protein